MPGTPCLTYLAGRLGQGHADEERPHHGSPARAERKPIRGRGGVGNGSIRRRIAATNDWMAASWDPTFRSNSASLPASSLCAESSSRN